MSSPDDDLSPGVGHSDLAARVALVGQLAHEELGELGVEDTIGDGLSPLADVLVAGHGECVMTGWWETTGDGQYPCDVFNAVLRGKEISATKSWAFPQPSLGFIGESCMLLLRLQSSLPLLQDCHATL